MQKNKYIFDAILLLLVGLGISWLLLMLILYSKGWLSILALAVGIPIAIALFYGSFKSAQYAVFLKSLFTLTTSITLTKVSLETRNAYMYVSAGQTLASVPSKELYTNVKCQEYEDCFTAPGHKKWKPGDIVEITIFTDTERIYDYYFE